MPTEQAAAIAVVSSDRKKEEVDPHAPPEASLHDKKHD
jgi:hypothetical protein